MSDLTEDAIDQNLIDPLKIQGYNYLHGLLVAPTGDEPQRGAFDSAVLEKELKASLKKLNPNLSESACVEVYMYVSSFPPSSLGMHTEFDN